MKQSFNFPDELLPPPGNSINSNSKAAFQRFTPVTFQLITVILTFISVFLFSINFITHAEGKNNTPAKYNPFNSAFNCKTQQGEFIAMNPATEKIKTEKTGKPAKLTAKAITHNSTEWFYKVIEPGKVKIILSVKQAVPDKVKIIWSHKGNDIISELTYKGDEDHINYYETELTPGTEQAYFDYYFLLEKDGKETRYPASTDEKFTGWTGVIENVPDWAKDVVWYQIFPERFRNGNPSNDPTLSDIKEPGIKNWKIREWGSDWYAMDDWEKENYKSVFQSIFQRRYGGDLEGVIEKLDYLKSLGISAIYINPVFRAPSLHKYDGSTFHHIDETFGPDPEGDRKLLESTHETGDPSTWVWTSADKALLKLIQEAHKRDMKVIIDGVFNHSGRYFFAFEDILKNGKNSPYKNWYTIKKWDSSNPDGFVYKAWFGVHSLPEFKRDDVTLNREYKDYLFNITKRWMAPNGNVQDGIDGWRLDVAFCIPHGFWKEWRRHVKGINPNAYLTAEVVTIDNTFVKGDEFDAMMNYPFAFCVVEYFVDKKNKIAPSVFDRRLEHLRNSYPEAINYVMQNLMSSHDSPRLRTLIVNPDLNYRNWETHFGKSKIENNPNYRIDRGSETDRRTQKLIAIFQMTYLGAPMIYNGDEVGMTGANDPDCRKPMLWDDIQYQDETTHPVKGKTLTPEKNIVDKDLLDHYKKVIKIRNENPALRRGNYKTLLTDDEKDLFAFRRVYQNNEIIVIFNNSEDERQATMGLVGEDGTKFEDLLNRGPKVEIARGKLKVQVKPKWACILRKI